jgi:hypothetical protein
MIAKPHILSQNGKNRTSIMGTRCRLNASPALLQKKNTKKEKIKIQYRNGAKDVLFLESKMFFLQEQIMVCARKSNIFDTFSVLNLNPNEKKNTFSKSVIIFFAGQTFRWIHDKVSI